MEVPKTICFCSASDIEVPSTAAIFWTLPVTVQLCFDADLLSVVVYTLILYFDGSQGSS